MKKGKAAKKAAIAVVTAVAVGGVSVGGYYGIRQAQKKTVKVYPVSDFTSGYWGDSMNMEARSPRRLPRTSIFPTARPFPRFSSKRAMW